MSHEEQLAWEARAGKPAAVAAIAAALLTVAAGLYLPLALADYEGTDGLLRRADLESGDFITGGAIHALSLLLVVPPLLYLYRATRYRHERLMPAAAVLAVLGAVVLAVATILRQLDLIDVAEGFSPGPGDADEAAEEAIKDGRSTAVEATLFGGSIALAFAFVMISLNAMRAGLLSRFMAILGIFVGVLLVLPLGVQVIQLFWLIALGLLFLDKWPGGRGPAWQTGEAIPWPGAAEQRAEVDRRRAEREGEPAEDALEAERESERPASRKRKKKRP